MNTLVTGGAGFIGSHLADALVRDGDEVTVLDDLSTGDPDSLPAAADLVEGDVRDRSLVADTVTGADVVFHQAGLVSVDRSVTSPHASHGTNATGTLNVLEAARKHEARVVVASSAAMYGHPEYTPVDEAHPTVPTSPYGLDKLTADHYARLYYDLYDLDTISLRYFNVYGPGQPPNDYSGVISIFIEQAIADASITVHGDGEQTRDFVFVEDVVEANRRAATTDGVGRAYNIATGSSVTIRELAELIVELTDSNAEIIHTEPRAGDIRHSVATISAARAALDYDPTVSLRDGLERTIEWFQTRDDASS